MMDSSLLYNLADGKMDFVHDTYRDFFFAKWLSQSKEHIDYLWGRLANPQLDERKEEKLKSVIEKKGEIFFDRAGYQQTPYHTLELVPKALRLYVETVEDATYMIESGLKLADEPSDGLNYCKSDVIRLTIADLINKANHVEQPTIDKFVNILMGHTIALGGCGVQWTPEGVLKFMLRHNCEPLEILINYYEGDRLAALKSLGLSYNDIGFPEKSIKCFLEVIEIDNSDPWDYVYLGNAYMHAGKWEKAISTFNIGKEIEYTLGLTKDRNRFLDEGIRMATAKQYDEFWLF